MYVRILRLRNRDKLGQAAATVAAAVWLLTRPYFVKNNVKESGGGDKKLFQNYAIELLILLAWLLDHLPTNRFK